MIASNTMPYQSAGYGAPAMFPNQQMMGSMPPNSFGPYQPMGGGSPYGNPGGYGAPSPMMGGGSTPPLSTGAVFGPQNFSDGGLAYWGGQPPASWGGSAQGGPQSSAPGSGYQPGGMPPAPNFGSSPPTYGGQQPQTQPPSSGFVPQHAAGQPGWTPPLGDMGGAMAQGAYSNPTYSPGMGSGGWGSYSQGATQTNPYLQSQLDGLQNQYNKNLTRNVLPSIQSGANAVGGIGGARQGIAQGLAMGDSQTGFANAAANLMGNDYEQSQNRALQAYQGDQNNALGFLNSDRNYSMGQGQLGLGYGNLGLGFMNGQNNYNLGQGGLQNQQQQIQNQYQLGQGQLGLQGQGQQLDFFNQQGSQDIQRYLAGLQGFQVGSNSPWGPLQNFGGITSPYTGDGTTTQNTSQGGGAMGGLGGALGAWQIMQMMQGH
jgi:hypothetical protein